MGTKLGEGTYGVVTQKNGKAIKTVHEHDSFIHEYTICRHVRDTKHCLHASACDVDNRTIEMDLYDYDLGTLVHLKKKDDKYKNICYLPIIKQILFGLIELHENGLVHADLKPDNILVKEHKDSFYVVLGDLGFTAKEKNDRTKYTGFKYRDPIVKKGKSHDMYGLGIILIQMYGRYKVDYKEVYKKAMNHIYKNTEFYVDLDKISLRKHKMYKYIDTYFESCKCNQCSVRFDEMKRMFFDKKTKKIKDFVQHLDIKSKYKKSTMTEYGLYKKNKISEDNMEQFIVNLNIKISQTCPNYNTFIENKKDFLEYAASLIYKQNIENASKITNPKIKQIVLNLIHGDHDIRYTSIDVYKKIFQDHQYKECIRFPYKRNEITDSFFLSHYKKYERLVKRQHEIIQEKMMYCMYHIYKKNKNHLNDIYFYIICYIIDTIYRLKKYSYDDLMKILKEIVNMKKYNFHVCHSCVNELYTELFTIDDLIDELYH